MSNPINYELDIRFPDQSPHRVPVTNKLSLGSSSKSDLCIEEYNLSPLHLSFRVHNGVLSLHNLGGQNKTMLGEQELLHGKMYILNIGDELKLGDIDILIREAAEVDETPDELKNLFEDKTDPKVEDNELIHYSESDSTETERNAEEKKNFTFQNTEDFVDEDESSLHEDNESEHKTLVQKLTKIFKFKKNDLQKQIVKNNNNISIPKIAPGFFTRLFSFISLLALSYTIVDMIFPLFEISKYTDIYIQDLQKILVKVPYSNFITPKMISITAVYILLDFTTTLLLGMNITYMLLGVRNSGNAFGKRFKGMIRSLLGIVTTPLIIFDLPCIIKKRTLKEFLSGSKLHTPSKALQSLGMIIIAPIILLSPLYTPILLNMDKFKPSNIVTQKELDLNKKKNVIDTEWSSSNMRLNFKGKVSKNLIILPVIKKNKKDFTSSIKFNSKKNLNAWTKITYIEKGDLVKQIAPLIKLNPMFSIHYPELKTDIEKENSKLSKPAFEQLYSFLKKSINLDPLEFQDIFLNHGPFLKDLIAVNALMKKSLEIQDKDSLTIYKNEDKILIGRINRSSKVIRTNYLLIQRDNTSLKYRVSVPKKYFRYTSRMIENFFQNSSSLKPIKVKSIYDWAKTLDTLTSISETKKDLTDSELSKTYEYYFEYSRELLSQLIKQKEKNKENFLIKKILISELNNIISHLESTTEFNDFQKVSELSSSLERLVQNLKNENLIFFSINN